MNKVYDQYWGKAKSTKTVSHHLFAYHSLDVVAVGTRWWETSVALRNGMIRAMGVDEPQAKAWMQFFLGLHDLGKLDFRFQQKAPQVAKKLGHSVENSRKRSNYDHGEWGFTWYQRERESRYGLPERKRAYWIQWGRAVTGHHGRFYQCVDKSTVEGLMINEASRDVWNKDQLARTEWCEDLYEWFLVPAGLSKTSLSPPCPHQFAGFCCVCDWLGSNETPGFFEYDDQPYPDLMQYFQSRFPIAQHSLQTSGLFVPAVNKGGVSLVLEQGQSPRKVQSLVEQLPVQPGLTIIEASTGSGKTETALGYASILLANSLADSVMIALPTQATANTMLARMEKIAPRLFPVQVNSPHSLSNLLLAHGKSNFEPRFIELKKTMYRNTAQGKEEALTQCSQWLAESRKRVFLGQIGVGTIDQVLMSVLPIRHQFVRGFGLHKSVLIVDEVHAYDFYMVGLLEEVLKKQREAGGSAIMLSATLPAIQKSVLLKAWSSKEDASANSPYPLITHVNQEGRFQTFKIADKAQEIADKVRQSPSNGIKLERLVTSDWRLSQQQMDRVLEAATSGAHVAIVLNLVDEAQRLFKQLTQRVNGRPIALDLFHARFRFKDRQTREQAVIEHYQPRSILKPGRILVATQVVEQSLDLDFDWLITHLCPVDLLFQRIGRLHRHQTTKRPQGFENPLCTVILNQGNNYGLHQLIYGNASVLWRTKELLKSHDCLKFPYIYRPWIEQVYQEDAWSDEPASIQKQKAEFLVEQKTRNQTAKQLSQEWFTPLKDNDQNAALLTRDGEMGLNLLLGRNDNSSFQLLDEDWDKAFVNEQINRHTVAVPASWKRFLHEPKQGLYHVSMKPHPDIESEWASDELKLRYSSERGLERVNG